MEGNFIIKGHPIPWKRAGLGAGRQFYDQQKHMKIEYGLLFQEQHRSKKLFKGPLIVELGFFMPIPKMTQKAKQPKEGMAHIKKPDADNLCKFILDAANGILFKDDCSVCSLIIHKRYAHEPRTEITIRELL
jgi:Holliday junction resolvase RusA-like endonuclease